ncbi:hypothetical protein SprV_0100270600 [Sparganum proliferum]
MDVNCVVYFITIFALILLNRPNKHLEQDLLAESQCGFRHNFGIITMIFSTRQLQEKCPEMWAHLNSTFVDLTKAFDTLTLEGLWRIMQKSHSLERFTQIVRQLHDGMVARVTDNGAVSEAFAVTNGVKRDRVLVPTLFILMFSTMLMDAYRDECSGIRIAYRTDSQLINQRRTHFQSRVFATSIHERRLRSQRHFRMGHVKEHGPRRRRRRRRLRQLRPHHQHKEGGGYASIATRRCLRRTSNQRERRPTESRAQPHLPVQQLLTRHQN